MAGLRAAPITVAGAAVVLALLAAAQADLAFGLTSWVPGALGVWGLVAVAAALLPGAWRDLPRPVLAALAALAAFTAWSYLTVLWAGDRGLAWEGANRTLLYLGVFALFALWPQRAGTATWLVVAWVLGLALLALVTLLRVPGDVAGLFLEQRLAEPAGYPNAAAATWLMALWPAVLLAAASRTPWWLRALLAAAAVVLAQVALLSVSRGALVAVPVCAVALLALVPGRARTTWALAAVGAGVAVGARAVLDVGDAIDAGRAEGAADGVVVPVLGGALLAALLAGAWAWTEGHLHRTGRLGGVRVPEARRAGSLAAAALCAAVAAGGLVAAGDPVDRLDAAWSSFKQGYEENGGGNRLTAGLGSNRYDFYRVSLDVLADHPVGGRGADNFFADYLRAGRSDETPAYPHSVVLRTLAQTGVVGALLLLAFLAAAAAAVAQALRAPGRTAVAAGAAAAFAYFLAHGAVDWFWEIAGLGAAAFAMLGLACALVPRGRAAAPGWTLAPPWAAGALVAVVTLLLLPPLLAERDVRTAADRFARSPAAAFDRLDRAAALNPLSARPKVVGGSIAVRLGDLGRARTLFGEALDRHPDDAYATLQLGAIESALGEPRRALARLRRARELAPRDALTREVLGVVEDGGVVDVRVLSRRIFERGAAFLSG